MIGDGMPWIIILSFAIVFFLAGLNRGQNEYKNEK